MKAHTPGPWVWEALHDYCTLVSYIAGEVYPNGTQKYIEVIDDGSAGGEYSPTIDVNGPDARLIAAAPDLLVALERLTIAMSRPAFDAERPNSLLQARAAIAKATGGQNA